MDKYELLDKELASLLGWEWHEGTTKKRTGETWDNWKWAGPCGAENPDSGQCSIRWTQDDGACFRLMAEHRIKFQIDDKSDGIITDYCFTVISNHASVEDALRWVIVNSVIDKLKGSK